jgi:hypothetical protein
MEVEQAILRAIGANDGKLHWRKLVDAVHTPNGTDFRHALLGLIASGCVEVRPIPPISEIPHYWITARGKAMKESGEAPT